MISQNKEAFVYCWTNYTTSRLYVGYHKGSIDDGYICSSMSEEFWNDFENPDHKWSRQIIAHGTKENCVSLEKNILQSLNLNEHYNNAVCCIIHTDEVKRKIGKANKGKVRTKEMKDQMSEERRHRVWFTNGHETSFTKPGKEPEGFYRGRGHVGFISNNPRGPQSEETKQKISKSQKGVPKHTDQSKKNLSEKISRKRHFTDGSKNAFVEPGKEPEGFYPGRTLGGKK